MCDTIQDMRLYTIVSIQKTKGNQLLKAGKEARMEKLNYRTLRQEVVDEIRQKILTGEFKEGERIKENDIAALFGVSRGPVREALRQIEQEGLVRYERNVGCSVASITKRDVYEVCLLRATLEILTIKLCHGKLSDETMEKMEESIQRMEQMEDDPYALAKEDQFFHGHVVEQSELTRLKNTWWMVGSNHVALLFAHHQGDGKQHCRHHRELLECFRSGNMQKMIEAIKRHYNLKEDYAKDDLWCEAVKLPV